MKNLLLISLLLTGCGANLQLVRPNGVTDNDARRDLTSCQQVALQRVTAYGMNDNMFVQIPIDSYTKECLTDLGYSFKYIKK